MRLQITNTQRKNKVKDELVESIIEVEETGPDLQGIIKEEVRDTLQGSIDIDIQIYERNVSFKPIKLPFTKPLSVTPKYTSWFAETDHSYCIPMMLGTTIEVSTTDICESKIEAEPTESLLVEKSGKHIEESPLSRNPLSDAEILERACNTIPMLKKLSPMNLLCTVNVERLCKSKLPDLSCKICNKTFDRLLRLLDHMSKHFNIKGHKCSICDTSYFARESYYQHMKHVPESCKRAKGSCSQQDFERNIVKKHCKRKKIRPMKKLHLPEVHDDVNKEEFASEVI